MSYKICLYVEGIENLKTLESLGLAPPYKAEYHSAPKEPNGEGIPVINGYDEVVWPFPSLNSEQAEVLRGFEGQKVYLETLKDGSYVVRKAVLYSIESQPGPAPLKVSLTLTFTRVEEV